MSGLLGNLVAQVAQSALNGSQQPSSQAGKTGMGGMADILGGMLGGGQQTANNGFGLDDVLGGVLASQMNGQTGGSGLGSVLGSVLGGSMGGGQQQSSNGNQGMLMAILMPMVLNWIQSKGGLGGALAQLQNLGMGNQTNSWMSVDQQNINLDATQVNQLFGEDQIGQIANQAGVDQTMVSEGIGALLPEVMNQLTPQGGMQNENEANQEIADILSQLGGLM